MQDFLTNKSATMPTWEKVVLFLQACEVPASALGEWEYVWRRLKHREIERRIHQRNMKNVLPLQRRAK